MVVKIVVPRAGSLLSGTGAERVMRGLCVMVRANEYHYNRAKNFGNMDVWMSKMRRLIGFFYRFEINSAKKPVLIASVILH